MYKYLLPFLLLQCLVLHAQKPSTFKDAGESAFADRRWAEALEQLTKYQELKPGDIGVLSKIGQSAYQLHFPDQAKQYLGYVTGQGRSSDPNDWYYYARTLHGLQEWDAAIDAYKQFLRRAGADHPLRNNVKDNILRCVSGSKAQVNESVAIVENLGNKVNSTGDDFAPLPSVNHSNRIYFSSSRAGNVGGIRNDDGFEDVKTGHWCSDIFVVNRQTTGWDTPAPFSSLQNTSRYEVALDFTNEGKVLHLFRGFSLYGGEIFTDTSGLNDEYSSSPKPFEGVVQSMQGDQAPFYYNDTIVIFASRREGGFGGLDLWTSLRFDGAWSVPVNLGPAINSAYDETTPYIAADGVSLYFSSNRLDGIGGMDVWKSVFQPETRVWSAPVSMGLGINSPGDDAWFRLIGDGGIACFASNRISDNLGEYDLYYAYFKDPLGNQYPRQSFALFNVQKSQENENKRPQVLLAPLYYTSDRDLLNETNKGLVKTASDMAVRFPETQLLITVHTDETGPLKFDLYAGIKKGELIAKALQSNGVPAERVLLRSGGPGFPIARNFINGSTNTVGQTLNKRAEIVPVTMSGVLPLDFTLDRPVVNDLMAAAGTQRLDEQTQGLIYRVELAVTRQVLTSDALGLFNDLLIESSFGTGEYHYMAGAERSLAAIQNIKKDVIAAGFSTASIAAYLNGVRLSRAEAVGLVKKYPDLAGYIRG